LTNNQRKYFGLSSVADDWDKVKLSDSVYSFIIRETKIVKVLQFSFGYFEYDTNIELNTDKFYFLKPQKAKNKS
jgi:hypothetical protein